MRVLFTVSNWPGHWYPMVPLGWALQAAGHEVRVLCTAAQVEPLTAAGLTPVPALLDRDMVLQARLSNLWAALEGRWPHPAPPPDPVTGEPLADAADFDLVAHMRESAPAIVRDARRSTDATAAFARAWRPDLVLWDLASFEGRLAAAVAGVPGACHLWGPVGTAEEEFPLVPADYSGAFARHGVADGPIGYVVDPCPDAVRPATHAQRLPVAFLPYNGPGQAPAWLLEPRRRRRVCVVWGNSANLIFGPASYAVPRALHALAGEDVEVVVTANKADREALGGDLPANARVLEHVPLRLLLPTCDAVLHYAGAGCAMTSVAAGVPQLTLPNGLDQYLIGRRVAESGAGIDLPNHRAGVADIRTAVRALLAEPSYRDAAARLARQNAARPSPAQLVGALERLAGRRERVGAA